MRCPEQPREEGSPQPGDSSKDPPITPPRGQQPCCPLTAPSLTGAGEPAPVGASTQGTRCCLPPPPPPPRGRCVGSIASPRPALPQPGHMCFQCGWELQGVGVLRKQHQIPFRSSNGPQQPPRGRAGGGDARTLQDRARGKGNPRLNTGIPAGRERGIPRHQPRAGLQRSVLTAPGSARLGHRQGTVPITPAQCSPQASPLIPHLGTEPCNGDAAPAGTKCQAALVTTGWRGWGDGASSAPRMGMVGAHCPAGAQRWRRRVAWPRRSPSREPFLLLSAALAGRAPLQRMPGSEMYPGLTAASWPATCTVLAHGALGLAVRPRSSPETRGWRGRGPEQAHTARGAPSPAPRAGTQLESGVHPC